MHAMLFPDKMKPALANLLWASYHRACAWMNISNVNVSKGFSFDNYGAWDPYFALGHVMSKTLMLLEGSIYIKTISGLVIGLRALLCVPATVKKPRWEQELILCNDAREHRKLMRIIRL
ncbi:hypothetical protein VNO77_33885 [Canavalia gladiata]|uniref:Uncharacterized protein n=1 Tax=Canavalia gladiata TaxID=3824 RepID=A0AAN9KE70_CANGL